MAIDGKALLAEVRENIAKLDSCPVHVFRKADFVPGKRLPCLNCGGNMNLQQVRSYIDGYKAAGGDPESIFPGYYDKGEDNG